MTKGIIWNEKPKIEKFKMIDTSEMLDFKMPTTTKTTTQAVIKPLPKPITAELVPGEMAKTTPAVFTGLPETRVKVPGFQKEFIIPQVAPPLEETIKWAVQFPEKILGTAKDFVFNTLRGKTVEPPKKPYYVPTIQQEMQDVFNAYVEGRTPWYSIPLVITSAYWDLTIAGGFVKAGVKALSAQAIDKTTIDAWDSVGRPTIENLQTERVRILRKFHPDNLATGDAAKFKVANSAFQLLEDKGIPTPNLLQKVGAIAQKLEQPAFQLDYTQKPYVDLEGLLPERAGYEPTQPYQPYKQPAFGLSTKNIPIKPLKPAGKEIVPKVSAEQLDVARGFARKLVNIEITPRQFTQLLKKTFPGVNEVILEDIGDQARVFLDQAVSKEKKITDIENYISQELGVEAIPAEKGIIPQELQPLAQEARKYKSAEEFVGAFKESSQKIGKGIGKTYVNEVKFGETTITGGDLFRFRALGSLESFYAQAIKGVKKVKAEVPITPPKPPSVITPTTELPKYPEDPYKRELLQEIGNLPALPKIESGVLDWKPPTLGYQNPITKKLYKVWDKFNDLFTRKAPAALKTFQSKEIKSLALEKQRVIDGLTRKYTEEFVKPLTKLSTVEKQKIGQMIFKYIPIEPGYKSLIKNIDVHIGQLGKSLIDLDKKLVAEDKLRLSMALLSEDTWFKNLGSYMRTLYIRPPKIAGGKQQIIPRRTFSSEGIIDRSSFKRKLTDMEWGLNSLQFEGRSLDEIKTLFNENPKQIEAIGVEAKKAWGWRTEADLVLARTFKDMTNNYATRLWQEAITKSPELFSKTFKEGFISIRKILPKQIETDVRLGPLNDGYINPVLTDEIRTMIRSGKDALEKILGEPLSWWKAFKVAGNPATVARNYLSGAFIQTDLAGYPVWSPKNTGYYVSAVKDYITKSPFYKKLRDTGMYGADYYAVEIEESLMREIERSANPVETVGKKLLEKLGDGIKDSKKLFSYYGSIDHLQRTYLAKVAMRDGATPAQAIHFANKWELDYRFVPKIIEMMRGPIGGWITPFISFYSLMAPRILETVATRPWVLLKYPIIIAALAYFSRTVLNYTKEQAETAKPNFLQNDPYTILTPFTDENGNPIYINLTYTLPFGGWQTGFIDVPAIGDMIRSMGLVGSMQAVFNNYDPFTQSKIFNDGDLPEDKRKKVAAYVMRFVSPGVVQHALNIWDAAQGKVIGWPYPREKDLTQVILRSIGISTYTGGYNEAVTKIRNYDQQIKDMQTSLASILRNVNISAEEKQKKTLEVRQEIENIIKKIQAVGKSMPPTPISSKTTTQSIIPQTNIIWK